MRAYDVRDLVPLAQVGRPAGDARRHEARVRTEEPPAVEIDDDDGKSVLRRQSVRVLVPEPPQSVQYAGQFALVAPMQVDRFHEIYLFVSYSTKRQEKKPIVRRASDMPNHLAHRSAFGTLRKAGCRAVTWAVPRALFMVRLL